ncbi:MAG: phenylacetic acid degradation bifunctional protein PaaZ [Granulosicoccus sp.]
MGLINVNSYIAGQWIAPDNCARQIKDAVSGATIATAGHRSIDEEQLLDYARDVGGPLLRVMTFHQRARMLKALATHLDTHKQALYSLGMSTGATQSDNLLDIDGGIGTLFVYASKGRREMPDSCIFLDGEPEVLSKSGQFMGQHIYTSRKGVAIHINAFNFPVWGMLEKLGPALLAGMPVVVKPATATCHVTELAVRLMLDSGLLPEGALQLVIGRLGNTFNLLNGQDVISFTGSADTAATVRAHPNLLQEATRFIAEQDSLNATILGPDAQPESPEFNLFVKEVHHEITTKAGQKCTAMRRILVPDAILDATINALKNSLHQTVVGNPTNADTQMGALVSQEQRQNVLDQMALLEKESERVVGNPDQFTVLDANADTGAFLPPMLLHCTDPDSAKLVHEIEAFGPIATIMCYRDIEQALSLVRRSEGALVVSVFSHDTNVAQQVVAEAGSYHGRLYFNNRDSMAAATGHGTPLPHLLHGGPGRAGGSEEMGGIRGVFHYMQRSAVQGSPDILTAIGSSWLPGSRTHTKAEHPFTRFFDDLQIGETLRTATRSVSSEDIAHFAHFTGDTFYAHMDDEAARRNPFFPGRVAHGYLLLSFAAGLFVDPSEGPVLANAGLSKLRFLKPVVPGDMIQACITVKYKTPRNESTGEVWWHVELKNQAGEPVALYELSTINARDETAAPEEKKD